MTRVVTRVREQAMLDLGIDEEAVKKVVEGDWGRGEVYLRRDNRVFRLLARSRRTRLFEAGRDLVDSGVLTKLPDLVETANATLE